MGLFKNIFNKNKTCIIAEKYSVALEYSRAFNCDRGDNCFQNSNYIIVWTDGHLCTLYNPEDYNDKYKVWKLEDLPIDPNGFWVKVRQGKQKRLKEIKEIINKKDITKVCIATDSAREGNLIGEYLLMVIENKKPVYRAMINSYGKEEIIKGIKEMKLANVPEVKNMTLAAQARDEIDWLIGTNLSRAYSLIYKRKYYVGRCKSVILNLLCKKEDEINSAEQKIYYTMSSEFITSEGEKYKGLLQMEITSEVMAKKIKNEVEKVKGEITKIVKDVKTVPPAQLLNLNDLIIVCSDRFDYTSKETYDISQKLYEEYKLISYARTDSRYIKKSMLQDVKDTLESLNSKKVERIKDKNNINLFETRCVNDEKVIEHSAIIPLKIEKEKLEKIYSELQEKEKNVYDLIVDNFVCNFLEDYVYESYSVETTVNAHKFITHIQRPITIGWRVEQSCDNNNMNLKETIQVSSSKINIEKKLSSLPERYTTATLFGILADPARFVKDKVYKDILKEQGIGTNATRALLIEDLIKNEYIIREERFIIPTVDGLDIIRDIKTDNLKNPYFTAEIEKKLQDVQEGTLNKDIVINEVRNFIKSHIDELKKDYVEPELKLIGICPKCKSGKIVKAGDKGYGCTNLKALGCRFYISKEILGASIDQEQVKKLINNNKTDIMQFKGKDGLFTARIILDKQSNTKFSRE